MSPSHSISLTSNPNMTTPTKHHRWHSNEARNPRSQNTNKDPNLGMSPSSRYNHNLKVLRRRDPSIISIFDQFSHVCVYHYNGVKWEKQGFEGSMFLYERESYPPYGFYILNRMGMDDYIQRLYPEDDVSAHGSYLMLRSFPDYTSQRLAAARNAASTSGQVLHKFSDVYAIKSPESLQEESKGRSQTVGLWMFATDAREPLIDVMLRLHSYIKKNMSYPQEFRYSLDRPPPPNPRPRSGSRSPSKDDQSISSSLASPSSLDLQATSRLPSERPTNTPSELDLLFSKLDTAEVTSPASPDAPASSIKLSAPPSAMTVQGLFGAFAGTDSHCGFQPASPQAQILAPNRGLTLLNTIFASASPSPDPPPINGANHDYVQSTKPLSLVADLPLATSSMSRYSQPQHSTDITTIVNSQTQRHASDCQRLTFLSNQSPHSDSSPSASEPASYGPPVFLGKRSWASSTPPAPQVLTQEVIFNLLNLGSEHRTSVSSAHTRSSSTSTSSSRLSRYSGDAEDEDEGGQADSDAYSGFSHTTTVFDTDPDTYGDSPVSHSPALQPVGGRRPEVSVIPKVNGDVTPRAPWRRSSFEGLDKNVAEHIRGLDQPERLKNATFPQSGDVADVPSSSPFVHPSIVNLSTSTDTIRSAAIINADRPSTLISPQSPPPPDVDSESSSDNVGELWPDSREPIDDRTLGDDADIVELDFADTSALSDANAFMNMIQEKERTRTASAVAASGNSYLQPNRIQLRTPESGATPIDPPINSPLRSRNKTEKLTPINGDNHNPPHSISSVPQRTGGAKHDRMNGKAVAPNGRIAVKGQGVQLDRSAVQRAIHSATPPGSLPYVTGRNEFVRELLTLVHTDKSFVDELWRDYTSRLRQPSS